MHNESECAVQNGNGLTDRFQIKSGMKQGFLFLLLIECIMRKATADNNIGIR